MHCLFSLATSPTPVPHSPGAISYHQTCSQMKGSKNNSLFPGLTPFLPYFVWFRLGRARGFGISSLYTNLPAYAAYASRPMESLFHNLSKLISGHLGSTAFIPKGFPLGQISARSAETPRPERLLPSPTPPPFLLPW